LALVFSIWAINHLEFQLSPYQQAKRILRIDPMIGWLGRPHLKQLFFGAPLLTDGDGFRVAASPLEAGRGRLWIFGPSSAWGWGVAAEQTYAHTLAKELGLELRSRAVPGHSSKQGELLLQRETVSPGDTLVFAYGVNDLDRFRFFFPDPISDLEFFSRPLGDGKILRATLREWIVVPPWLRDALTRFFPACPPAVVFPPRSAFSELLANLNHFQETAKARGARLVVLSTAYRGGASPVSDEASAAERFFLESAELAAKKECPEAQRLFLLAMKAEPARLTRAVDQLNSEIRKWAKEKNVIFVEDPLRDKLAQEFVDPVHFSVSGHEKWARAIRQSLKEEKK
jgi:lysophospholipase L1-like esterase